MDRARVISLLLALGLLVSCDCFHRVRGTVCTPVGDPDGLGPVEGATVLVYRADVDGGSSSASTRSEADGSFDNSWPAGCLPPARAYRLVVMKDGYRTAEQGFWANAWSDDEIFLRVVLSPDENEGPSDVQR